MPEYVCNLQVREFLQFDELEKMQNYVKKGDCWPKLHEIRGYHGNVKKSLAYNCHIKVSGRDK